MKILKIAAAAVLALGYSSAYAFHSGGVAECEGCHSMHPEGNNTGYLLVADTQSAACLSCHQHEGDTGPSSYHISTAEADQPAGVAPIQMTPGGDFGWLRKTYTWVPRSGSELEEELGERHGHNINAPLLGYNADLRNTTAPGSTAGYPAANLHCSSCHDPHGKWRRTVDDVGTSPTTTSWQTGGAIIYASGSYQRAGNAPVTSGTTTFAVGAYRILAGTGYAPHSFQGQPFVNQPPNAAVNSTYNRSEATSQTRVAYGSGMSEWCGNCHDEFVQDVLADMGALKHPASNAALMTGGWEGWSGTGRPIWENYNSYVRTGNMTGNSSNSFLSLVPFELGTGNYAALRALAVNAATSSGTSATSNVACISCHRAHASGFGHMLRFSYGHEFMTRATLGGVAKYASNDELSGEQATAMGKTEAETQRAYYERLPTTFAPFQRVLCNKCHAKD